MFRRRVLLVIAAAFAFAMVAGCAPAAKTVAPAAINGRHTWTVPDTLRIATGFVPRTLNPVLGTENIESSIARLFSDVLVESDAHGNYVPDLAAAVPTFANGGISADGLTIRYHLRRHVTWQDGHPFSSADVKFTYDAIMNRDNDVDERAGYDIVKSVETPDANTIIFQSVDGCSAANRAGNLRAPGS